MHAVVLAGGTGTRLWPLSRRDRPKPFLPLIGEESLFQRTLRRIEPLIPADDTLVVAEQGHLALVSEQAPQLLSRHLIGEPFGRNTAAAIALAATTGQRRADDVMVVLPADHHITEEAHFRELLSVAAEAAADGSFVTLGITPTGPETGYGYIVGAGGASAAEGVNSVRRVERFVEKPAREQALELLGDPRGAWWNAGIFVWRVEALREGLAQYAPGVIETLRRGLEGGQSLTSIYEQMPTVSIDRALMEPASLDGRVKVVPADVGWTDLGSWDALHRMLAERVGSRAGVVTVGRAEDFSSQNLLAHSSGGRLVVTMGLRDTIVVDTPDVVLVTASDRAQDVRAVVDSLAQAKENDYL